MPSLRRAATACASFFALLTLSCDATGPDAPRLVIDASPRVAPGGDLLVTVTAIPPGGGAVDRVRLDVHGLVTFSDSVSGAGQGTVIFTRSVRIPSDVTVGEVVLTGTLRSGSNVVHDTVRVEVRDAEPPRIETLIVQPTGAVNPHDTVRVTLGAQDDAGLRSTSLRFSGAFSYADSVEHGLGHNVLRTVAIPVPTDATLGTSLTITAEAVDAGGHRATRIQTAFVADTRPPTLMAWLIGPRTRFSPGDTLQLRLTASDSYRLDRVEYRIGSPAVATDTFRVAGTSFERVVTLVVDESWMGTHEIVAAVRDAGGNVVQASLGSIWVVRQFAPGPRTVSLGTVPRDLAHDAKRNVVYVSLPDANRVAVVSLDATPSLASLVESLPRPFDIDVTPGGDTLLIAPRGSRYLYRFDLERARVDSLLITEPDPFWIFGLDHVRAMANGVALVTVTFNGSGAVGKLMSADLVTGVVRMRKTVGSGTAMARSADRRKALVIDGVCCPLPGSLYDAATDVLSADRGTIDHFGAGVSSDSVGSRFLISSTLFTGDLSRIREYQVPERFFGTSVLSPDGTRGYFATQSGFAVVRLADGVIEGLYLLNGQPGSLVALPNGRVVLAVVGTILHVVDLR